MRIARILIAAMLPGLLLAAWKSLESAERRTGSAMTANSGNLAVATFAGSRFWCVEADFTKVEGVVEVVPGSYKKNPLRYRFYRFNSGRDHFLKTAWGETMKTDSQQSTTGTYSKPGDEQLRHRLTPLQYRVTRENGTEPPFNNKYWNNKRAGATASTRPPCVSSPWKT